MRLVENDVQTERIIGAAMAVHSELGCGFLEAVYQETLALELVQNGVPFERERQLSIRYKNSVLRSSYRADFVCFASIIVKLKAIRSISGVELAQVMNYLKATGLERGLILNFGTRSLQIRRVVKTAERR